MSEIQRKTLRTVFTKKVKAIDDLISQKGQYAVINSNLTALTELFNKLQSLNEDILQGRLAEEDVSEDVLEKEVSKNYEYSVAYYEVMEKAKELKMQDDETASSVGSNISNSMKMKLPKIELKKFDGQLKNWIGFWVQFSKIHEDNNLREEDKFDYLLQTMSVGSPARKMIEGFPPSKENYQKAIDLLKSRYGKDELLIEYYVRELLSLVLKREQNKSITVLYDALEVQLRSLESLNVTKEKYAAMLFPLMESALPEQVFKAWERHRVNAKYSTTEADNCLTQLLEFLRIEIEAEERLKLRNNSFDCHNEGTTVSGSKVKAKSNVHPPSASVLEVMSTKPNNVSTTNCCIFCLKNSHQSQECFKLIDLTVEARLEAIKSKGACLKCLKKGHFSKKCRAFMKCHICKGNHLSVLCQSTFNKGGMKTDSPKEQSQSKESENQKSSSLSVGLIENSIKSVTYLQTLNVYLVSGNQTERVRVICDSGSQKSFISDHCVQKLNLKSKNKVMLQQEVFGGQKTKPKMHTIHDVTLRSLTGDYSIDFKALQQPVICNQVPRVCDSALIKSLQEKNIVLTDICLSDGETDLTSSIDILIGADLWARIVSPEYYKINDQLIAIKTMLGWTIVGSSENTSSVMSTMFVSAVSPQAISQFWDLEVMGIAEPTETKRREEKELEVVQFFEDTVKKDDSGRYVVKLPWVENHPVIEDNKYLAEKRLQSTTRKLHHLNLLTDYDSVFKNWESMDIIEKVKDDCTDKILCNKHYLPHRAVVKEESTTRIRPVFDASNKDRNGYSVNLFLDAGPNLIELIPKVLTKFRKHAYGLTADIEKAFLQIKVDPTDCDMLRFLWWENEEIIVFRHKRLVFGLSCSPFLLGAVINNLLENTSGDLKEVALKLKGSFYVDNCLVGVDSLEDQCGMINDAQSILKQGSFNLRNWEGNGLEKSKSSTVNLLGIKWVCSKDEFGCNIPIGFNQMIPKEFTRREFLSCAQKIFDPIGFTAPTTLIPKIILQKSWGLKLGWDDELPEDLKKLYLNWANQLQNLENCKISRRIFLNETSSLHVFCDASKEAFGTCIFLRTELEEGVHISLVLAKSRVAPTKVLTLPRLELMGALTGLRLSILAIQCLEAPALPVSYWLDSSVALAWIFGQGKWSAFVENRVKEINQFSKPSQWKHIPGNRNPADLLSRGCSPQQLLASKWWMGPDWLYDSEHNWPNTRNVSPDLIEVERELRKSVTTVSVTEPITLDLAEQLAHRISKYSKIVRTIAWILRLSPNNGINSTLHINTDEFNKAEQVLFKLIQKESFPHHNHPSLSGVHKFEDENGILRLKSRLLNQDYSSEYLYPIILPSSHPVVIRLIEEFHLSHNHAGVQTLLVILREKVWILKGRKVIRQVVNKCVVCKRYSATALQAPISPLPEDRTNLSSCFQVTGVDLAGPLLTNQKEKCWIVIFTCAVYRAVHFELVQSLSTDAFIYALRRFIARRGRIKVIYSDNGTNFVGLNNKLQNLDWEKITAKFSLESITWRFNPPAAPWWGGFWERLVKILKDLLKRNLGNASLGYEELHTLVCECESIMNNRPLTYVTEEIEDLRPLTPSMFLQSIAGNNTTDLDILEETSFNQRLKYLQTVRNGLKSRFEKEYLGFLRSSKKNQLTKEIKEGDIVLIHNENKRLSWPLGKVIQLFPGKDKITRLVKLKTKNGEILRPIQRLYSLEVSSRNDDLLFHRPIIPEKKEETDKIEEELKRKKIKSSEEETDKIEEELNRKKIKSSEEENRNKTSKRGRLVKTPKRLDL